MSSFEKLHPRGDGGRFTTKPAPIPTPAITARPISASSAGAVVSLHDVVRELVPPKVSYQDIDHPSFTEVTLPAGSYVIGDPCYMVSDENKWLAWLHKSGAMVRSQRDDVYVADLDDGNVLIGFPTGNGDGVFPVSCGRGPLAPAPVDAGLMGIAPLSVFGHGALPSEVQRVDFTRPVHCFVDLADNGHVVRFGDVSVTTVAPDELCLECDAVLPDDGFCTECFLDTYACDTCGSYVAGGPTDACSRCEPDTVSDSTF